MPFDDLETRKGMSFEQAEGVAGLPTQLERTVLTRTLRARLAEVYVALIDHCISKHNYKITSPILGVMKGYHIRVRGRMPSSFSDSPSEARKTIEQIFNSENYTVPYGFIQFSIRQDGMSAVVPVLNRILISEMSAFRVMDNDTLVPVGTEAEAKAITDAISVTKEAGFQGAYKHIKQSTTFLSEGSYADSIRESIHAVESTARTLQPGTNALSKALAKLENDANIHGSMKGAFNQLYGYTSDEEGIRHPLLSEGDSSVDEIDAIFMLGACSSFVTYLIGKSRKVGIV